MLRNNEKMLIISSTSNEWTQQNNQIDDHNMGSITTTTTPAPSRAVDHKLTNISQEQQKQQQNNSNNQEPMRCPRCDSSNTKFCYYNNYSLSQPRHFCKACKRYWTRGGTLRNVPVGGGCRKNKRVKRPHNPNCTLSSANLRETSVNSGGGGAAVDVGGNIRDLISSNSNTTLFYNGLQTNDNLLNFPFSHQINGLGLGFSSGLVQNINVDGMNHYNKQNFQDFILSNPSSLSIYPNTTTTTTTTTTTPTISSLLASTFHMKGGGGANNFETLLPSYGDEGGVFIKDVKMEIEGQNRSLDCHTHHSTTLSLSLPTMALLRATKTLTSSKNALQCRRSLTTVTLPDLPYDYAALEPAISGQIMQIHHQKHHQTYVTNYNNALQQLHDASEKGDASAVVKLQSAIKFNGGGHVNHSIFWKNLAPIKEGGGEPPKGSLGWAIDSSFGSLEALIKKMNAEGAALQGSGWVWLGLDKELKRLVVETTGNQDPLVTKGPSLVPLLGIDVWEHAYYLQYKNVRPDYLKSIWKVMNWKYASEVYEKECPST